MCNWEPIRLHSIWIKFYYRDFWLSNCIMICYILIDDLNYHFTFHILNRYFETLIPSRIFASWWMNLSSIFKTIVNNQAKGVHFSQYINTSTQFGFFNCYFKHPSLAKINLLLSDFLSCRHKINFKWNFTNFFFLKENWNFLNFSTIDYLNEIECVITYLIMILWVFFHYY